MNNSKSSRHLTTKNTSSNHLALAAIGASFVAIIGCTLPFVSMQLRSPLPFMATPKHKVEKALNFLIERRKISKQSMGNTTTNGGISNQQHVESDCKVQSRFVDLGSGDGATIFAAASLNWKSTGIELNHTLWAISSLRRFFQPAQLRSSCSFIHGDMFQNQRLRGELRKANCVMVFGVNSLMPRIADLIQNECQRGAFVMSYRFRVPLLNKDQRDIINKQDGVKARNESITEGVDASLIYEEEEMRVYEISNESNVK